MKAFFALGTLLLLTACATSNPYNDGSDTPEVADLPPISIFYAELGDDLGEECQEFQESSLMNYCRENSFNLNELTEALGASGRFPAVVAGHPDIDYQILVSSAEFQNDDAKSMANAIVSGASLMLVPMTVQTTLKTEFVLMWRGDVIERFSHEMPIDRSASLLTHPKRHEQITAKALSDSLIQSIDENDSMSAAYLFEALDASDYQLDTTLPDQVADFRLTDRHLYRDPFMGTLLNFNHTQFAFDRIDVFIYPIRATHWDNAQELIQLEMANNRAEIEYFEQEGHIDNVELNEPELRHWTAGGTTTSVGFMDGYYLSPQQERLYTSTYVFIKEDKFVKVRASFPKNPEETTVVAPDHFVQALIPSISVPTESTYMARLRKIHHNQLAKDSAAP